MVGTVTMFPEKMHFFQALALSHLDAQAGWTSCGLRRSDQKTNKRFNMGSMST